MYPKDTERINMCTNSDLLNEIRKEIDYIECLDVSDEIEIKRSCYRIIKYASLVKVGKITGLPLVATRKDRRQ